MARTLAEEIAAARKEAGLPPLETVRRKQKNPHRLKAVESPPVVDSHQAPMVDKVVDSARVREALPVDKNLSTKGRVDSHQEPAVDRRKGDRHSKNKGQYNNWIDEELLQEIKVFCTKRKMKRQEFAEMSAILFMSTVDSHHSQAVDSLLTHDDRVLMIGYKTEVSLINLYLQYNPKNKWTPKDDRLASVYNGADIRIIECGIIDTQLNKGVERRIHTFDYYRGQIDFWLENMQPGQESHLLAVFRRRWAKAKAGEKPWEEKR